MTQEHFWPLWLIDHARVQIDGVVWADKEGINPRGATIPLCEGCNNRLGAELEAPVSRIMERIETDEGISDNDAELLVRWLWKFEGIAASFAHLGQSEWRYSDRWTMIDRILGNSTQRIRGRLVLAIGLTNRNDEGYRDWPMGLDSGLSDEDAIFVSGVFGRTALMVSLSQFAHLIPRCFGLYSLQPVPADTDDRRFFPPVCFPYSSDAIGITRAVSIPLKLAHEELARNAGGDPFVRISRPRIVIPNL